MKDLAHTLRKSALVLLTWLALLILVISRNVVEATMSAVATCVFQILPVRENADVQAPMFDDALSISRKIEGSQRKTSQMALYTAAREYFESFSTMADNQTLAGSTAKSSSAERDENRSGSVSMSEVVETFSMTIVTEIIAAHDFGTAHDTLRQAIVKLVLALIRQLPSATTPVRVAARGQLSTILKKWRSTERSRPLQKHLDEALEANQKAIDGAE